MGISPQGRYLLADLDNPDRRAEAIRRIQAVVAGSLTRLVAAERLGISKRSLQRILAALRTHNE